MLAGSVQDIYRCSEASKRLFAKQGILDSQGVYCPVQQDLPCAPFRQQPTSDGVRPVQKSNDVLKFAKSPDHFLRNVTATSLQRFLKDKEVNTVALKGVLKTSSDWAEIVLLVWRGRFADVKVKFR